MIKNWKYAFFSLIMISLSVLIRSNGMFSIIIIGYKILENFYKNFLFSKDTFKKFIFGIFGILIVVTPYIII